MADRAQCRARHRHAAAAALFALLMVVLALAGLAGPAAARGDAPLSGSSGAAGVAFSPDGTLLAGGYADGTIRLWHVNTGQPDGSSWPAGRAVNAVAFSPDGTLLAGGYADGTIRLW